MTLNDTGRILLARVFLWNIAQSGRREHGCNWGANWAAPAVMAEFVQWGGMGCCGCGWSWQLWLLSVILIMSRRLMMVGMGCIGVGVEQSDVIRRRCSASAWISHLLMLIFCRWCIVSRLLGWWFRPMQMFFSFFNWLFHHCLYPSFTTSMALVKWWPINGIFMHRISSNTRICRTVYLFDIWDKVM